MVCLLCGERTRWRQHAYGANGHRGQERLTRRQATRQVKIAEEAMGDSNSGIPWTQDALTELNTLALRWQLTDDHVLNLRRQAEAPAFMEVTPSDVRAAWDNHRPKLYPRPVS